MTDGNQEKNWIRVGETFLVGGKTCFKARFTDGSDEHCVVINGEPDGGRWDYCSDPVVDGKGDVWYAARKDNRTFLMINGSPLHKRWDHYGNPVVDRKGDVWCVAHGHVPGDDRSDREDFDVLLRNGEESRLGRKEVYKHLCIVNGYLCYVYTEDGDDHFCSHGMTVEEAPGWIFGEIQSVEAVRNIAQITFIPTSGPHKANRGDPRTVEVQIL